MNELFSRSNMLLPDNAEERLRNSSVIVFGLGGVGSYTAEALCRSGIGALTLVDSDTVSDSNRITTPSLPPEAMEKISEILRENLKDGDFTVDHPRRSLEDFFLNVISTAKRDSVETAGVVGGGKIADYLENGDTQSAVLASLIAEPQTVQPAVEAAPQQEQVQDDVSGKLEDLTVEVKAPEKAAPAAEKPAEDLAQANAKLDDLLGNNNK